MKVPGVRHCVGHICRPTHAALLAVCCHCRELNTQPQRDQLPNVPQQVGGGSGALKRVCLALTRELGSEEGPLTGGSTSIVRINYIMRSAEAAIVL